MDKQGNLWSYRVVSSEMVKYWQKICLSFVITGVRFLVEFAENFMTHSEAKLLYT